MDESLPPAPFAAPRAGVEPAAARDAGYTRSLLFGISLREKSAPRPLLAPVTMATFPFKIMLNMVFLKWFNQGHALVFPDGMPNVQ